jgi:hypothetical protein
LTIPAPQSAVVQLQGAELIVEAFVALGDIQLMGWLFVSNSGCGNGVAVAFNRVVMVVGVRLLFAPSINAIVPETIGAEKLVPRFGFSWSV